MENIICFLQVYLTIMNFLQLHLYSSLFRRHLKININKKNIVLHIFTSVYSTDT